MSDALPSSSGVTYEVELEADAAIEKTFDTWLRDHVADVLQFDGFLSAEILAADADSPGHIRRIVRYRLHDRAALDDYLRNHAARMDAQGTERFGGRISAEQRTLASREEFIRGQFSTENCLNCGEVLTGQHCSHCGQRARVRVLSLWGLLKDLFGDLFEWDSRVWRTLRPLAFRPGLLTQEYLRGRRASYTPPFRMYLVLSLLFFLVAFFDPRESLGIFYEPQTEEEAAAQRQQEAAKIAEEVRRDLAAEGLIPPPPEEAPETGEDAEGGLNIRINGDGPGEADCQVDEFDINGPEWLKRRLTPERLVKICEDMKKDNGRQFLRNLYDNIPIALIVLLPIMAFVLKLLYPLSRRYYVEHLLFFVHFHAFLFLILTLQILVGRLNSLLPTPEAAGILIIVAASFYVPVYLFVAMRRVYGQGRLVTAFKYVTLSVSYFAGFTVTMIGAALMAAFSV